MQTIFEDESERDNSKETNSMDTIIYVERISGYIEREFIRRSENKKGRIWIGQRIFVGVKKEVWRERWGVSKSSRT